MTYFRLTFFCYDFKKNNKNYISNNITICLITVTGNTKEIKTPFAVNRIPCYIEISGEGCLIVLTKSPPQTYNWNN